MTEYQEPSFPAIFRQVPINPKEVKVEDLLRGFQDLITVLGEWNENLKVILDAGINSDNKDEVTAAFTSNATPDTEDGITHTLGKVPSGFRVVKQDKSASVYDGGTTNTKTLIYIKASVASVALTIEVF